MSVGALGARRALPLLLLLSPLLVALPLHAEQTVYVVAIGHNAPPSGVAGERLEPLRYADDDAAAFSAFTSEVAKEVILLSLLDEETQRLYPELAAVARSPTPTELVATVERLAVRFSHEQAAGRDPVLIFFYSGHGYVDPSGTAALTLDDGALTNAFLYEQILERLPARYVHLVVDACHADAVVRTRGDGAPKHARTVPVRGQDIHAWAASRTLERFSHVGAIVATSSEEEAHEWDGYQGGVFTHELLSAIRGAADVNGDQLIAYGEIHAFLEAANRGVEDPRAKLSVLVKPPALNHQAPLMDLLTVKNLGLLVGSTGELGHFYIEDERGRRLLDMHAEASYKVSLALPTERQLYLRSAQGEAAFALKPSEQRAFEALSLSGKETASRGAVTSALHEGLYRTPFGPAYFRGFNDSQAAAAIVSPPPVNDAEAEFRPGSETSTFMVPAIVAWSGAVVLGVAAAVSGGLTLAARSEWENTSYQRASAEAADSYYLWQIAFWSSAAGAAVAVVVGGALFPWELGPQGPTGEGRARPHH